MQPYPEDNTTPSNAIYSNAQEIISIIQDEVAHALQTVEIAAVADLARLSTLLAQSGYGLALTDDSQPVLCFTGETATLVAAVNETGKRSIQGFEPLSPTNMPRVFVKYQQNVSESLHRKFDDALRAERKKVADLTQVVSDLRNQDPELILARADTETWKAKCLSVEATLLNLRLGQVDAREKPIKLEADQAQIAAALQSAMDAHLQKLVDGHTAELKSLTDQLSAWTTAAAPVHITNPAMLSGAISLALGEIKASQAKSVALESDLAVATKSVDDLSVRVAELEEQAKQSTARENEHAQQSALWVTERLRLKTQNERNASLVTVELPSLKAKLQKGEGERKTLMEQVEAQTKSLRSAEAERDKLKEALRLQLELLKEGVKVMQSEIEKMKTERDDQQAERDTLQASFNTLQTSHTQLQAQLTSANSEATMERELLTSMSRSIELERDQLKSDRDRLAIEVVALKAQATTDLQAAEGRLDALKTSLTNVEIERNALKAQVEKLVSHVKELSSTRPKETSSSSTQPTASSSTVPMEIDTSSNSLKPKTAKKDKANDPPAGMFIKPRSPKIPTTSATPRMIKVMNSKPVGLVSTSSTSTDELSIKALGKQPRRSTDSTPQSPLEPQPAQGRVMGLQGGMLVRRPSNLKDGGKTRGSVPRQASSSKAQEVQDVGMLDSESTISRRVTTSSSTPDPSTRQRPRPPSQTPQSSMQTRAQANQASPTSRTAPKRAASPLSSAKVRVPYRWRKEPTPIASPPPPR